MLTKNQQHTVTITGWSSEGLGVARIDGQVVFVHGAVRGEVCRVQIIKVLKRVAYAKVTEILERSPARMEPDCPLFGRCGGCQFRHVTYEEELEAKRCRVEDAVVRLAGVETEVLPTLPSPQVSGYRNKAQFPVSPVGEVGFYRPRSHQVLDVSSCALQGPAANAAAAVLRDYMEIYGVPGYDETTGRGEIRHLYIRSNRKGESLICIVCRTGKLPHQEELIKSLLGWCAPVAGILVNINPHDTNVILGDTYRTLWGAAVLEDVLCDNVFSLSPAAFYQVNRDQAERLYGKALEFAGLTGKEKVLDLYCGAGTITLALAGRAAHVTGVEVVPQAVENARENAARNGIDNVDFFLGDAGEIAAELAKRGEKPDVIVVDPPRKGLSPQALGAVADMAPERIVYVSCDAGTMARDVNVLKEKGYRVDRVQPVDMFPRTVHVETVVRLSKKETGLNFRMAGPDDVEQLLSLYQSVKGEEFCAWNDNYPTMAEIQHDLETKNLYVMTHDCKIAGAISVVPENELDGFGCWSWKNGKEIARVVVAKAYRGQGIAFEMVQRIEPILRRNGCEAIRLSVAKSNIPAYRTYIKAGFAVAGEADMYGNRYYLMEKAIDINSH